MDFSVSFQTACLFFFFAQGLLFAGMLLIKSAQYEHRPSRWLRLFIALCSLYLVPFMYGYSGWYDRDDYRDNLLHTKRDSEGRVRGLSSNDDSVRNLRLGHVVTKSPRRNGESDGPERCLRHRFCIADRVCHRS